MPHRPAAPPTVAPALDPRVGIVVHSHLRWDFVWQRPQQILSRMARCNPVLFVEEPLLLDDVESPVLDVTLPHDGVFRAVPRLPRALGERYDEATAAVRRLVADALARAPLSGRFERAIQWFYTPMPAPEMLGAFGEEGVVYDCMDELSKFRFAPPDIGRRERLLLARADVVFTGGWRLYESKSRYHDDVHFFGCGVDARHYAAARLPQTVVPPDAARIDGPVLGYFGVVDERLDYDLIRALAAARADWTVLMIGPVAKVDPRDLPQAPNLRWLGQRSYDELPAYVKRFDVCLMPFALNEATEFINPTKTLEYMAAGRPIVSTPVADVVRNFGSIVRVAATPADFIAAASDALERGDDPRVAAGIERAAQASWERTVTRMRQLIASAIAARTAAPVVEEALADVPVARHAPPASAAGATRSRLAPGPSGIDLTPETGAETP